MHIIKIIHSLHFKNLHVKMSVIHIKIKIKNPTCFGHSYSTIIRGSQCLRIYYYQCACNISYAYVAVCYLCVCTSGVLERMVSARVQYTVDSRGLYLQLVGKYYFYVGITYRILRILRFCEWLLYLLVVLKPSALPIAVSFVSWHNEPNDVFWSLTQNSFSWLVIVSLPVSAEFCRLQGE
jgi:hypothetical protein